jgi:preprotein translocase subunit YajC
MPGFALLADLLLFAQAPAAGRAGEGGSMLFMLQFIPVVILFYFFFIRPTMQQDKQRRQMLTALKKNDRVITDAGIFGTVVAIDSDSDKVVLRVDDDRGVKLTFLRSKVAKVLEQASEKDKERTAEAV